MGVYPRSWIPLLLLSAAGISCLFLGSAIIRTNGDPHLDWHRYAVPADVPSKYAPQTDYMRSHVCTLEEEEVCSKLDKRFTLYWNMRFDNHYRFHDIRWGRYNGCHRWKNNTKGTVLWLYLPNHLKAVAHRNWKVFLEKSHPAGCFFVVFAARGSLYQSGTKDAKAHMGNESSAYAEAVASTLSRVSEYFNGFNVAWYIASRVTPGPNPCNWTGMDWPRSTSDYLVSATSFGAYVAKAHGIPTTPYDILLHSRPDLWFGRLFDHDELYDFAREEQEQLQIGFRQTSDWEVGDEDPGNQIIITTRGVVEDTCLHNWAFDANVVRCGACRGQLGGRLEHGGIKDRDHPEYWSCGHEHLAAMQSMSRSGARSFLGNPLFFMGLSSSANLVRLRINAYGERIGKCVGVSMGKDQPPCIEETISLLNDSYEFFHSLDGSDATAACVVGNYNQRKGVDNFLYKVPEKMKMPTYMMGHQGPVLDSTVHNVTWLDHPVKGHVMLRGPMFFRGFLWLKFTPMLVPDLPTASPTTTSPTSSSNSPTVMNTTTVPAPPDI
mmetsp:Transcript_25272/g.47156  ORF Transcript_25272/g.47156 Transcript_25272/m.47156 type:complete len:549 (-) Transcript_25272:47-1693(-)